MEGEVCLWSVIMTGLEELPCVITWLWDGRGTCFYWGFLAVRLPCVICPTGDNNEGHHVHKKRSGVLWRDKAERLSVRWASRLPKSFSFSVKFHLSGLTEQMSPFSLWNRNKTGCIGQSRCLGNNCFLPHCPVFFAAFTKSTVFACTAHCKPTTTAATRHPAKCCFSALLSSWLALPSTKVCVMCVCQRGFRKTCFSSWYYK